MKRLHLYVVILVIGLWGSSKTVMAQIDGAAWGWGDGARWGLGAGAGVNNLYSDLKNTGYGVSAEGYLTRRFNSRFGLTGLVGYGVLPFTKPNDPSKWSTNVVRGDLRFDYELASGSVRPYVGFGVDVINFRVTQKTANRTFRSKKRFTNLGFGPEIGLRFMFGSRYAFNVGGKFDYTTGDTLDATATTKANDAIITGMVGFTTFFGGGSGPGIDLLASEQAPVEDAESQDIADFQQRIDQMESAPQQQPQDMQEYVRLKSRMDELNQEIGQKEGEINTLRTELDEKNQTVSTLQTQLASTPARSSGSSTSFSRAYEEALSQFYAKRYSEAIAQFNTLLAQFPDHSLASNCVYWTGESYFGSGNYREAANAFNRVLSYPRSLKKDDALLMLGRSHLQLNQREEARQAFDRLIREFPTSEFVAKAEEWLNRM